MSGLTASVCPYCGAPLRELVNGACPYCKTVVSGADGSPAAVPERPAGTVWLHDCGRNKIAVIKVLREHTGWGLAEAKAAADAAVPGRPAAVIQGLSPEAAAAFADDLRKAGAQAEAG